MKASVQPKTANISLAQPGLIEREISANPIPAMRIKFLKILRVGLTPKMNFVSIDILTTS